MASLPYVIPYDPGFLGDHFLVPMPAPCCTGVLVDGGRPLDYIHYSLVLHKARRTAVFTAHNIDAGALRTVPRSDNWSLDGRARDDQVGRTFYSDTDGWDKGHLVRRDSVAWGDYQRALDASNATFFFANAAPQHERFNRDEWADLEEWVVQQAGPHGQRLCVFTGPLFTTVDQVEAGVRIPSAWWKIVVLRDPTAGGADLATVGFLMKQNEHWDDWSSEDHLDFHTYQVGIRDIGRATGLDFGQLAELDEYEWRQVRFRDRSRMHWFRIQKPEDIKFFGDRRRAAGVRALRVGGPGDGSGEDPPTTGQDGGCGCVDTDASRALQRDAAIKMLVDDLGALRKMVEGLLDVVGPGAGGSRMSALRRSFDRIVGGSKVRPEDYPDCVCIGGIDDDGEETWFCSGVLVHPRLVLTAAHCAPAGMTRVFIGHNELEERRTRGQVVDIAAVIVHPDYVGNLAPAHDIALVLLARDVVDVTPAVIASRTVVESAHHLFPVGFGYSHPYRPWGFGTKREVRVDLTNMLGEGEDAVRFAETQEGFQYSHELHAGRKDLGKDSCNGDSGGPAYVLATGDTVMLAGLTSRAAQSFEQPCGDGGIYTRVEPYLAWIHDVTGIDLAAATVPAPAPPTAPAAADAPPVAADTTPADTAPPATAPAATAPPGPPTPGTARLVLTAVMPDPVGTDAGAEWVDVHNLGPGVADLGGHDLADRQGGRQALSGPLDPGSTRRVVLPKGSPVKLSNAGDDVLLMKGDVELDRISWDASASGVAIEKPLPQPTVLGGPAEADPFDTADPC